MIDLHTHSKISDGSLNPEELILYAAEQKVSVVALTDHDSTEGLERARCAAVKAGIVFVSGIELNVEWPTGEFHLLGLGLQRISDEMISVTERLQKSRDERNKTIIELMRADGFAVSYEELSFVANSSCIGRPHFAQYFVQKGLVKNRQQAFDKFIAKGRPYYANRTGCALDEGIEAIRSCGGVPVLAHPLSLYVSWGKMNGVLSELKEHGICALEAWHPGARPADCKRLESTARQLEFAVTAGSDFHGTDVRADRRIGHTSGGEKIDDRFWFEELVPLLENVFCS